MLSSRVRAFTKLENCLRVCVYVRMQREYIHIKQYAVVFINILSTVKKKKKKRETKTEKPTYKNAIQRNIGTKQITYFARILIA